ncbi:MAG: type I-U CRISPR-associated protein Cas5/Cas6 [Spirochaetaceae bacterium]|nr:MAG: type I-U CRISPR-associated protein Cas5/Cas6 [Spirochaetaceae bacterium]
MFSIAWRYLTGQFHAADFTNQAWPEWPPHPDRVFQALVASWAARGCSDPERDALLWLERLDPPAISVPDHPRPVAAQSTYVPPNDIQVPEEKWKTGVYVDSYLGILPEKRKRKRRHHAATWVGDGECALTWQGFSERDFARHEPALRRLCEGVTRIGRSSSFVACWVSRKPRESRYHPAPDSRGAEERTTWIRLPWSGRLRELEEAHQAGLRPPPPKEVPYRTHQLMEDQKPNTTHSPEPVFSDRLLIFRIVSDRSFSLSHTLKLTSALRSDLIRAASLHDRDLLPLVSGHAPSGTPLDAPHLAYIPLPYVGGSYGSGRVFGVAIVPPAHGHSHTEDQLYRLLGFLIGEDGEWEVPISPSESIRLASDIGATPPVSLRDCTWLRSSTRWASVTPVGMDRMQNRRRSDPDRWAAGEVERMLVRAGYPEPASVRVMPVSVHRGSPAVFDVPPIVRKDGRVRRMVHVDVQFPEPVSGPILIGSGRYRGYGLCKPCTTGRNHARRR